MKSFLEDVLDKILQENQNLSGFTFYLTKVSVLVCF